MQLAVGLMGQIAGNIVCDFNPMWQCSDSLE